MKKTISALLCIIALLFTLLTACSGTSLPSANNADTNVTQPSNDQTKTDQNDKTETNDSAEDQREDQNGNADNTTTLTAYKTSALSALNNIVDPVVEETEDEDIKAAILRFYNSEKEYIDGMENMENAKAAASKVLDDAKAFAKDTLKPLVIEKLNAIINPLINKISQEDLKTSVKNFYDTEMEKLSSVETINSLKTTYTEILDDTKEFLRSETEKIAVAFKNMALEELDPYVTALIEKIPYDKLKRDTLSFYDEEKEKLSSITQTDDVAPCVSEIKDDITAFALSNTKEIAVTALESAINNGLEKLPNQELKNKLTIFATQEIEKLNAINDMNSAPTTIASVSDETQAYIKELLSSIVKGYLAKLTEIENATAYDYLPEAMHPTYSDNVVEASSIKYDFGSFTNVATLSKAGFGEQWQMIVDNINQSVTMAKVFNVAQTALNSIGNAVNVYIENSYADEIEYTFDNDTCNGIFAFKDNKLTFNISFTELLNIPVIGSVQPVIRMEYDLSEESKVMFINLGDAYKVKYTVSENAYEMITKYGVTIAGKKASRASFLSIEKTEDERVVGHIYEYTTYENSDLIKACADFYVENGYVSVVGNKSSGMIGFDGYINELYLANEGRLLGYEVRETKTIAKFTAKYDTLWFNLWDIQGIDSIKISEKTEANKSDRSTVDVYCNGSSELLSPTYNTKLTVKTSRQYDIEMRSRYYYTFDQETNTYTANEILIPMLFIQEDNFDSFANNIKKDNGITASVVLNKTVLNKILADYDTLIDVFIENKDLMSSETIASYLE